MRQPDLAVFLKDVSAHEMHIALDTKEYRHLRFRKPNDSNLWFDLINWPGCLTVHGDMGTWTFSRTPDMFTFFRRDELKINPSYWSEKLQAGACGGHRSAKEYSDETFERQLIDRIKGYESEHEQELLDAAKEEILSLEGEWARVTAAHEFQHDLPYGTFTFDSESVPDGRDYGYHFLWCLYAIVWGIQQYDQCLACSQENGGAR